MAVMIWDAAIVFLWGVGRVLRLVRAPFLHHRLQIAL
jgi:hypothetical protein